MPIVGQVNDFSSGRHLPLSFLKATPSSQSQTLRGLFKLTQRPSRDLNVTRCVASELLRFKNTVRCVTVWHQVQGLVTLWNVSDANLDCEMFVEITLFLV